jgi:hypothetical protein
MTSGVTCALRSWCSCTICCSTPISSFFTCSDSDNNKTLVRCASSAEHLQPPPCAYLAGEHGAARVVGQDLLQARVVLQEELQPLAGHVHLHVGAELALREGGRREVSDNCTVIAAVPKVYLQLQGLSAAAEGVLVDLVLDLQSPGTKHAVTTLCLYCTALHRTARAVPAWRCPSRRRRCWPASRTSCRRGPAEGGRTCSGSARASGSPGGAPRLCSTAGIRETQVRCY